VKPTVLCLLLLVSGGCFRTTIIDGAPGEQPAGVGVKVKHSLVHGLIELGTVDVDRACPNGGHWLMIREQMTSLNSLLTYVSLGLYTPRAIHIYCSAAQPATAPQTRSRAPR
jgi:hypothetical protein